MSEPRRFGKYEVLEKVGEGGFGTVYRGRDPVLDRTVAIKTLKVDAEETRKRFLREAKTVAGLQHPNLVTVHDFGVEGDRPYLVQEFLDGEDLSARIKRKDPTPLETRVRYLAELSEALHHAHEAGIIHRDVKPSNVRVL
ncbi:MAG: serine/threonine protein kinase, partial [Gemmatimonadetes bacterium]|nr:serine/threonine protein kinase [Gemmatimonadota bacterium]